MTASEGSQGLERVVVTGYGAVSAAGGDAATLWQSLLQGRCAIRNHLCFAARGLSVTHGGSVDSIAPEAPSRDVLLAQHAIDAALGVAQAPPPDQATGLIWGASLDLVHESSIGRQLRPAGDCFARLLPGVTGTRRMIATACASGTQAIGEAFRLLRRGHLKRCVAGGSSAMLTPHYLAGFAALQVLAPDRAEDTRPCRPFDVERRGISLADGAAALVLETLSSARRRRAPILGEVLGYGSSQDAHDLNSPPPDGRGAQLCMQRALRDATCAPEDIDAVNAHATGTVAGDAAEATAIRAVFTSRWRSLPVSSIKGAIGHAMGAAGALGAVVALLTCAHGIVPPTVGLQRVAPECELDHVIGEPRSGVVGRVIELSFGMGGQNAAIILAAWEGV